VTVACESSLAIAEPLAAVLLLLSGPSAAASDDHNANVVVAAKTIVRRFIRLPSDVKTQ